MGKRPDFWVGLSPSFANTGLPLRDNGVCLVGPSGVALAISEERLSRQKHDNAYELSLSLILAEVERQNGIIHRTAYSTCSDSAWSSKSIRGAVGSLTPVPSHHYSHALSAYLGSSFDESLVIVSDAGGNTLRSIDSKEWWACPREQTSVWYGASGDVHLLKRYHDDPYHIGFGEWYRAFTYYLGWPSHTLSGNTMALSAYGKNMDLPSGIWDHEFSGTLGGILENNPRRPLELVSALLKVVGLEAVPPRAPAEPIGADQIKLAAYIQSSLESGFLNMVSELSSTYAQSNICLSGGVAQNCVLAARLADIVGLGKIFVSAYSGDVGQCVGNALYARSLDVGLAPRLTEQVFLGPRYDPHQITAALSSHGIAVPPSDTRNLSMEVAQRLADGQVVAIFVGRSEFGARALGHRSVLCDPMRSDVVAKVKREVKQRDEFMPLAPVIGGSMSTELLDLQLSTTMTFAPLLPYAVRAEFGEAVHVDGTARIQVASGGELLSHILDDFHAATGRRVLINTSFNRRGEPIVETPEDALTATRELSIDCLVFEDRLVPGELLAEATTSFG